MVNDMFIKKEERDYKKIHIASKVIVCTFNTILLYIITLIGLTGPLIVILLAVYNVSYFFGVNTVSRILERILHKKEKHDWI